jgi:hypothetical protein
VNELARFLAFIPPDRFRLQGTELI